MLERNRDKERTQMATPLPTQVMGSEEGLQYRVPECLSNRLNWVPSPVWKCCSSPLWGLGRRHTRLRGGGGGSQFRRLNRHSGTLYSKPSSLPTT